MGDVPCGTNFGNPICRYTWTSHNNLQPIRTGQLSLDNIEGQCSLDILGRALTQSLNLNVEIFDRLNKAYSTLPLCYLSFIQRLFLSREPEAAESGY